MRTWISMSIAGGLWLTHCACKVGDGDAVHVGAETVPAHARTVLPGEVGSYGVAVRRLKTKASAPKPGDGEPDCRDVEFVFGNGFDRNPEFISRVGFEDSWSACIPEVFPSNAADVGGFYAEVATADVDGLVDPNGARTDEVVWGSLANTGADLGSGAVGLASGTGTGSWSLQVLSAGATASVAAVAVADLNNDGLSDVIAGTWRFVAPALARHLTCRTPGANPGVAVPVQNTAAASVRALRTEHIFGAPLVIYLQQPASGAQPGGPTAKFGPPLVIDDLDGVTHISVADLNRDGRVELVTSGVGPHLVNVLSTSDAGGELAVGCVELPIPSAQASGIDKALEPLRASSQGGPHTSALAQDVDVASVLVPGAGGGSTVVTTVAASVACLSSAECLALRDEAAVDVWTLSVPQGGRIIDQTLTPAQVHRLPGRMPQALRLVDVVGDGRPDLVVSSMFAPCVDPAHQISVPGLKSTCVGGPLLVSVASDTDPLGQEWRPIQIDATPQDPNPFDNDVPEMVLMAPSAYRLVPYTDPKFGHLVTTEECSATSSPLSRRSVSYFGDGTVLDVESVWSVAPGLPDQPLAFSMLPDTRVVVLSDSPATPCVRVDWIVMDHPGLLLSGIGTSVDGIESPSLLIQFDSPVSSGDVVH